MKSNNNFSCCTALCLHGRCSYLKLHLIIIITVMLAKIIFGLTSEPYEQSDSYRCISLNDFMPNDTADVRQLPKCFCDRERANSSLLTVSCLEGSKLADLSRVMHYIQQNGLNINTLYLYGIETGEPIKSNHFKGTKINTVILENCNGELQILPDAFCELANSLQKISINSCSLKNLPWMSCKLNLIEVLEIINTGKDQLHLTTDSLENLHDVREIDLRANAMNEIPEDLFRHLNKLKSLTLSNNQLNDKSINGIFLPSNLINLSIADNELQKVPFVALKRLDKLKLLDLTNNNIENLTNYDFNGLSSLKLLDLRSNQIRRIESKAFFGLQQLKQLKLGGNYISGLPSNEITEATNLDFLDLSANDFAILERNMFKNFAPNITTLDISNNEMLSQIDDEAFEALNKLSNLYISRSNLTNINNSWLYPLRENLQRLHLDGSPITVITSKAFESLHLRELFINSTNITTLPEKLFRNVLEKTAEIIDLSDNKWTCDSEIRWLINWLKNAKSQSTVQINNQNKTNCWLPESNREKQILLTQLSPNQLIPQNESFKLSNTSGLYQQKTTLKDIRSTLSSAITTKIIPQQSSIKFQIDIQRKLQTSPSTNQIQQQQERNSQYSVTIGNNGILIIAIVIVIGVLVTVAVVVTVAIRLIKNATISSRGTTETSSTVDSPGEIKR